MGPEAQVISSNPANTMSKPLLAMPKSWCGLLQQVRKAGSRDAAPAPPAPLLSEGCPALCFPRSADG